MKIFLPTSISTLFLSNTVRIKKFPKQFYNPKISSAQWIMNSMRVRHASMMVMVVAWVWMNITRRCFQEGISQELVEEWVHMNNLNIIICVVYVLFVRTERQQLASANILPNNAMQHNINFQRWAFRRDLLSTLHQTIVVHFFASPFPHAIPSCMWVSYDKFSSATSW